MCAQPTENVPVDKETLERTTKYRTWTGPNIPDKTTRSTTLEHAQSSISSLTTVDISLAPHQSTSSSSVKPNLEKGSTNKSVPRTNKIYIIERTPSSSSANDNETIEQDDSKQTTALEMCNDHLQLVQYQHNKNQPEENSGPKAPPIPVSFTMLIYTGSIIVMYVMYISNNHSKDDENWRNKANKVMLQLAEVFARFTRHFVPLYWLTKKEETRIFAIHKIKTSLLRYFDQGIIENILSLIYTIYK